MKYEILKSLKYKTIVAIALLSVFLLSCSPKIHGKQKRKYKPKDCGCELLLPEKMKLKQNVVYYG